MPEIYNELADDEFDYASDWKEVVGDQSPANGHFSAGSQEATLVGYVPYAKLRSAIRYFLGFSYADEGEPYRLYREPPARHPLFPTLLASSFSYQPVRVKANQSNLNNAPYIKSPWYNNLYVANYEHAVCTIRYTSFGRTWFASDSEIHGGSQNEALRYTRFAVEPNVEALTASGSSQLKFAEGDGSGSPPSPVAGITAFPAPIAELLAKQSLTCTWMNVAHRYLSEDEQILVPTKILSCVGKTNLVEFLGYPRGTLLMLPPKFEEVLYPVTPADPDGLPLTGWTCHFAFQHFDPDRGIPDSAFRGHRTFPWLSGLWYGATRSGSADGRGMLPEADFATAFEHVSKP